MRRTTLVLLAVALAACTTTPTAPPALDLPAATASDPPLERWWTAFNDTALTGLVDEALAKNLDLRAAITRVDAARAQVTRAQGDLYPIIWHAPSESGPMERVHRSRLCDPAVPRL